MSLDESSPDILKQNINKIYEMIHLHPGMFAGRPGCVCAYITALEGLLDALSGDDYRPDSYSRFRGERRYGNRNFHIKFEEWYSCRHGFIPWERQDVIAEAERLEKQFAEDFEPHWREFLEWRKGRQNGPGH